MNLARASVGRPVFTSMVTLIVGVLGLVAFTRLQIDLLPSIELPIGSRAAAPFHSAGRSIPATSSIVGNRSVTCTYALRSSPPVTPAAGQEARNGTECPPRCVLILYSRNGVFETIAQPRG